VCNALRWLQLSAAVCAVVQEARVQAARSEGRAVPDLSAETQYSDRDNIVALITDEHRRVEMLYAAFCETKDPDDRMILVSATREWCMVKRLPCCCCRCCSHRCSPVLRSSTAAQLQHDQDAESARRLRGAGGLPGAA
jgi:hypothetical protein